MELKRRRENKGLKSFWVAQKMGIKPPHLSMLESGERLWTDGLIKNFLRAIGES